jgi:hypothetical protein
MLCMKLYMCEWCRIGTETNLGRFCSRWWLPLQWSAQIIQRSQAEGLVNRWVLLPLVAPSTLECADHPARTGGRSCQQVGSSLAGSFLYSGVCRSSSAHRRKALSTGRFFSRCWLLYSGVCRSSSVHRRKVLSTGRFFSRW